MQLSHQNKLIFSYEINYKNNKNSVGIFFLSFLSIFYQKLFGQEPYNNSFSMGLLRFYFGFYSTDCQKLNGGGFGQLLINVAIYMSIVILYYKFLLKENETEK